MQLILVKHRFAQCGTGWKYRAGPNSGRSMKDHSDQMLLGEKDSRQRIRLEGELPILNSVPRKDKTQAVVPLNLR